MKEERKFRKTEVVKEIGHDGEHSSGRVVLPRGRVVCDVLWVPDGGFYYKPWRIPREKRGRRTVSFVGS